MSKSGVTRKFNGFWAQLNCTPSGTYGYVYTEVTETWGREGDLHDPPRKVTSEKRVASTTKFPAYHTDDAWRAVLELLAEKAGLPRVPVTGWAEACTLASAGRLFYWAPLDTAPRLVTLVKAYKNGSLRLRAGDVTFTADAGHADRFFR